MLRLTVTLIVILILTVTVREIANSQNGEPILKLRRKMAKMMRRARVYL